MPISDSDEDVVAFDDREIAMFCLQLAAEDHKAWESKDVVSAAAKYFNFVTDPRGD